MNLNGKGLREGAEQKNNLRHFLWKSSQVAKQLDVFVSRGVEAYARVRANVLKVIPWYCIANPFTCTTHNFRAINAQHIEISFQTKLDSEINAHFLLIKRGRENAGKFPKNRSTVL